MRRLLLCLSALLLLAPAGHSDPKTIAELDATTAVADGDLVPIWDISQGGASKTRKVAFSDFRFSLLSGLTLAGTSGSTLNIGTGGTLGTAAYTAASAYDVAGAAAAITKSSLGLANVENTALSTWAGTSNLITLGTVTTGTWHGTALGDTWISSASTWNAKEPGLGNPGTNGFLLSSTTGGTRSWVAPGAAYDPAAVAITGGSINGATLGNEITQPTARAFAIPGNGAGNFDLRSDGFPSFTFNGSTFVNRTGTMNFGSVTMTTPAAGMLELAAAASAPTGLILTSPDGTRYKVSVANGGTLVIGAAP